jgi:hypothetical protein
MLASINALRNLREPKPTIKRICGNLLVTLPESAAAADGLR